MTQTVRPPTVPTPVTTPSAGVSGSWLRAKRKSSWKSAPGSRRSLRRSRTKSLPSSFSLSRYLTWPCSMRARSWKYRSSLTLWPGLRVGMGPEDDDEDAVAIGRTADDGGSARSRQDIGVHLGLIALEQPRLHVYRAVLQLIRSHFEPPLARDREALLGAERNVNALPVQRRVVAVTEHRAQLGEDAFHVLIRFRGSWRGDGLGTRHLGRWRIGSLEHPDAKSDHRLGVGGRRRHRQRGERPKQQHQHRPEQHLEALTRVMQPRHHGPDRAVEHVRDLAIRQSFDITQHDNRSRLGRQGVERLPDALPLLGARRGLIGPRARIGRGPSPLLLGHPLGAEGTGLGGAGPVPVGGEVHRDAKHPGVESRLPPKRRQGMECPDESLLRAIPCLLSVVQNLIREAPHALPVLVHKRLEGVDVAGQTALNESLLVLPGQLRRALAGGWKGRRLRRRHRSTSAPPRSACDRGLDGGAAAPIHRARRAARRGARRPARARAVGPWKTASRPSR